ncbi:hypothetical protein PHISCL_10152 [Aspergillus sclerotialis]|uniref:Uncharacterized protein n=1 Tax=Aspergillus sclerotialis TaxID=2070753 RepID=A0A3A2ZK18_9EURO|nr:hypothetical protein PHISCL_10152 [Aspergillus sclerotialis]
MDTASPVPAGDSKPEDTPSSTTTPPVTNSQESSSSVAGDGSAKTGTAVNQAESGEEKQKQKQKQKQEEDDDDESDFDELDEVLDDFSKPKPEEPSKPSQPAQSNAANPPDLDEEAFMRQLEQDMANMMGQAAKESGTSDNAAFEAAINQGADGFTKQLEESGIPPGDFLKQLLADVMAEEGGEKSKSPTSGSANAQASGSAPAGGDVPESFNDAIQRTINRMKDSGDKATAAAAEDDTDDLVAQLLKAVEAGASGAGDDGDLSKMFMGMMEQLSNKEMLYEPMKELDDKFGPWLEKNKGTDKISAEDMSRFEKQAKIVKDIVTKFEEPGYTDKDSQCRDYVWEKMQEMQAAGNPPDELIANPLMDDLKGPGGAPAMPDCPQQ